MDKQEATKQIASNVEAISKLVTECEKLADAHGLSFYLSLAGYGTGATYRGKPEGWSESTAACEGTSGGWESSSSNC